MLDIFAEASHAGGPTSHRVGCFWIFIVCLFFRVADYMKDAKGSLVAWPGWWEEPKPKTGFLLVNLDFLRFMPISEGFRNLVASPMPPTTFCHRARLQNLKFRDNAETFAAVESSLRDSEAKRESRVKMIRPRVPIWESFSASFALMARNGLWMCLQHIFFCMSVDDSGSPRFA